MGSVTICPRLIANAPITGLTNVTVADNGRYYANANGTLGTGMLNVPTGSVIVNAAQTTFPASITLGSATWSNVALAGQPDRAGLRHGEWRGGGVTLCEHDPRRHLGRRKQPDTSPGRRGDSLSADRQRWLRARRISVGTDGVGAYFGLAIGPWCSSPTIDATLQARTGTGNLKVAVAGKPVNLGATSVWKGDGTSTTADIKVFPGNGLINLAAGGINGNAIGSGTPNLIKTFNIDGQEGDKSPAIDRYPSDERFIVMKSSGTGKILPGQTVRITNGVYQMDTGGAVDTISRHAADRSRRGAAPLRLLDLDTQRQPADQDPVYEHRPPGDAGPRPVDDPGGRLAGHAPYRRSGLHPAARRFWHFPAATSTTTRHGMGP